MNDQNPINTMNNGMPPITPSTGPGKNKGVMLVVLVVILLAIIGAIFVLNQKKAVDENVIETTNTENETVLRNENILENSDAQLQADLDAQLQDVDYSF